MNKTDANDELAKYHVYIDERTALVNASLEQHRLFDKAILTLSSGALGLSLTFIRQIIPEEAQPKNIYSLVIAWVLLALSILFTVISFLTSGKACARQIEILENSFFHSEKNSDSKTNRDEIVIQNYYSRLTSWLNILSIICFILGVFFLATFSICNLYT